MCNWVYKWFKTDRSAYSPDEIADAFIAMLEAGYLEVKNRKGEDSSNSTTGGVKRGKMSKGDLKELRSQCENMIALIDEMQ